MESKKEKQDWVQLISKLVWPLFIVIFLVIFDQETKEVYNVLLKGIKSGRSVEIGGFLKLGVAANQTKITELSHKNISIMGIGGSSGVVRKSTGNQLSILKQELENNPLQSINTLLVPDNINYSVDLLKQYISTLGLRHVVFLKKGKFDGWISTSSFVAQLPKNITTMDYLTLRKTIIAVNQQTVNGNDSAKSVLEEMQRLHIDSIPVVDNDGNWLFFANRGEILARLMTTIILEPKQ